MTRAFLAFGLLTIFLFPSHATAVPQDKGDEIWTAVVLATKEKSPKEPPRWLARYEAKLQRIFGYNQFEVIGRSVERMRRSDGQWLIPTKQFYLEVSTEGGSGGSYLLQFKLWHEKNLLLETKARVKPGSPLFVRGPQHGRGQVIFVVEVR